MKLFSVTADHYDYDQYDSIIVAANDKKEAAKMCVNSDAKSSIRQLNTDDLDYNSEIDKNKTRFKYDDADEYDAYQTFGKHQSPLTVTEIDLQNLKEPQQILGSFNAG